MEQIDKPSSSYDEPAPMWKLVLVSAIAVGVQFGWTLQLSLLTPYVQLLKIPHTWSAYIWLCGPVSGMLVQPIVGYYSDRCTASFGRRHPFILGADIGYAVGDDLTSKLKPRAITVFVVRFWVLDVANNMLQGPWPAFLADLSAGDTNLMSRSNTVFSFFMAVGNILGYAAGSYQKLYKILPFSKTEACDVYYANLKTCFIIGILLLMTITLVAISLVEEKRLTPEEIEDDGSSGSVPFFGQIFGAFMGLSHPMVLLLVVTCLNWIAWFPFLLFDIDWMGKEVYGGVPNKGKAYDAGVHAVAASQRQFGPDRDVLTPSPEVRAGALAIFAVLGIPLVVTYNIPFSLASIFSAGSKAGQGFWPLNLVRKKLQLVGITALLLACKYEEVAVPVVEDLIVISDRAYNRIEVLEMDGISVLSFIARAKSCSRNP
ncbi:hypothetical protein AgCh_024807 [Apium graveolens]